MINENEYQNLASALCLLKDYINDFCGDGDNYCDDIETLTKAEGLLREYENSQSDFPDNQRINQLEEILRDEFEAFAGSSITPMVSFESWLANTEELDDIQSELKHLKEMA